MTRRIPSACTLLFSVLLLLCGAIPLTRSIAAAEEGSEANFDVQLNRMQVDDPGAKEPGDDDQPTITSPRRPRSQTGSLPPTSPTGGIPPAASTRLPSEPFWVRVWHVLFGRFEQILR